MGDSRRRRGSTRTRSSRCSASRRACATWRVQSDAVEQLGAFAEEHGIDCWFHHEGVLGVRTGAWQEAFGTGGRASARERYVEGDGLKVLTAEETRAYADSPRFIEGAFFRDNAVVQPARLARGLRRLLLERGVHIYERTPMRALEQSRPAIVRTERGAVRGRPRRAHDRRVGGRHAAVPTELRR